MIASRSEPDNVLQVIGCKVREEQRRTIGDKNNRGQATTYGKLIVVCPLIVPKRTVLVACCGQAALHEASIYARPLATGSIARQWHLRHGMQRDQRSWVLDHRPR